MPGLKYTRDKDGKKVALKNAGKAAKKAKKKKKGEE